MRISIEEKHLETSTFLDKSRSYRSARLISEISKYNLGQKLQKKSPPKCKSHLSTCIRCQYLDMIFAVSTLPRLFSRWNVVNIFSNLSLPRGRRIAWGKIFLKIILMSIRKVQFVKNLTFLHVRGKNSFFNPPGELVFHCIYILNLNLHDESATRKLNNPLTIQTGCFHPITNPQNWSHGIFFLRFEDYL